MLKKRILFFFGIFTALISFVFTVGIFWGAKSFSGIILLWFISMSIAMIIANMFANSFNSEADYLKEVIDNLSKGITNFEISEERVGNILYNSLENLRLHMKNELLAALRTFNNSTSPMMAIDVNYNIVAVNKTAAKLQNKTPEELKGTKCYDLFKTKDCNTSKCALKRAMESKKAEESKTVANPTGSHEIPISYTGFPLLDSRGNVIGAVETVTDISAISKAQETVKKATVVLSESINKMDDSLKVIENKNIKLFENSKEVYEKSENIGKNMNAVSASIEETQTAFTSISAATEEMNATIGDIAQNSQKARTITENVKNAMNEIHEKMGSLEEASKAIQSVVDIITEIASQTNLLALNATIEAARAGEAGKGFAVVANEIKNLATETNNATADIKNKISNIIYSTREAAGNISSIKSVTDEMSELVIMIASAIEQQSATTNEITASIVQSGSAVKDVSKRISLVAKDSNIAADNVMGMRNDIEEIKNLISELDIAFNNLLKVNNDLNESVRKLN